MAVGLSGLPELYPVAGVRLAAAAAGIKKPGRRDLVVIECAPGSSVAGVFTRNRFCAAPVSVARRHLAQAAPRACLINAGNANAGTGEAGIADALSCCAALAAELDVTPEQVLPFSTGVIGARLPVERMAAAVPQCVAGLSPTGWDAAAHGIMTTDTVAKGASRRFAIGDAPVTVTGIAKGAGMIRPDMATLLAFIATDAAIDDAVLAALLAGAVGRSFNRISIDGDTSTNDACILMATGQAGMTCITGTAGEAYARLAAAVAEVCEELAQAIVRDAEGATKFITLDVINGRSEADCLEVAYTIAHSPLVKTAFFASDPNWGRVLAAVGRARVDELDVDRVSIYFDDVCVLDRGAVAATYTESQGQAVMRREEITLRVDLGAGASSARIWTSDLSYDYVRINAEYRT